MTEELKTATQCADTHTHTHTGSSQGSWVGGKLQAVM